MPTLCRDSGLVSPFQLRWVKGVCVFRCNLPSVLLAEWPGFLTCHCGNTGVERTPNKSQHTKLTLEKTILLPLLPGFELATFRSGGRRFTVRISRLPNVTSSQTGMSLLQAGQHYVHPSLSFPFHGAENTERAQRCSSCRRRYKSSAILRSPHLAEAIIVCQHCLPSVLVLV